jgi:hypothetical protein
MKACRITAHSAHACLSTAPIDRLTLSAESWQHKALRKRNLSGPDSRVEKSTLPGGHGPFRAFREISRVLLVDPISTCPNAKNSGGLGAEPSSSNPKDKPKTKPGIVV